MRDYNVKDYKTKDLWEAILLYTVGKKYIALEEDLYDTKRMIFRFEDKEGNCEELITRYWQKDILVDADRKSVV